MYSSKLHRQHWDNFALHVCSDYFSEEDYVNRLQNTPHRQLPKSSVVLNHKEKLALNEKMYYTTQLVFSSLFVLSLSSPSNVIPLYPLVSESILLSPSWTFWHLFHNHFSLCLVIVGFPNTDKEQRPDLLETHSMSVQVKKQSAKWIMLSHIDSTCL